MLDRISWTTLMLGLLAASPAVLQEGCPQDDDDTPAPTPNPWETDKEHFDQFLIDLGDAASEDQRDTLTQEFLYDVRYSDGFPIVDANTVTFVYLQEYGVNEPLRVSGQFNDWNPDANLLARAVPDYRLFYTTLTLPDPTAYGMYKFVGKDEGSQDVWFADPVSRRYQYDEYGEYSLIAGGTASQPSHLERYPAFHSNDLGNDRDLYLYLPAGYEKVTADYPVIYMHDGQNLFDPEAFYGGWGVDKVIDDLVSRGRMQEVIVVGIPNTIDRMDEYTHVEDYFPVDGYIGGDADLYAQFLVDQVKPFVDSRYRTRPERASSAVLGSSLGGLVSYYIGSVHDDVFRYIGGMSSTFGWGSINVNNETMIEVLEQAPKLDLIYYLDSGGDDGGGCVDTDNDGIYDDNLNAGDNYCETLQMNGVLQAKGYTSDELLYVFAPGQEHNEASWNSRLHYPLTFWFPAN